MVKTVTLCSAVIADDREYEPPMGALYIASALEACGCDVDWRDFQLEKNAHSFSGEPLAQHLAGHAKLVAISCFADMLPAVIDATWRLHQMHPDSVFILGGPGPTAAASLIVAEYPWINGVVCGEGEETIQDWIYMMRDECQDPIPGMVYRKGRTIVAGPVRPRNKHLDTLPLPAYHLLDWRQYKNANVITSRGCAYHCSFCDVAALWGNLTIYRSLELTIAEMEMLRDRYGRSRIGILDDTFVLNPKRVQEFCRMLVQRRSNIKWGCFARINLVTPDLIQQMAEAGCSGIFYGIDSGSQRILDRIAKRIRCDEILPMLRFSAQHFDNIEVSFIWGYPFETLEDFRETLDLASEASKLAPVVSVQFHMLAPLPLSPIYRGFSGKLREPTPEDRPWTLLPALLLDEHADMVRDLVRSAPDIYPGFFTYPTPDKRTKRNMMERSLRMLNQVIGRTFFDGTIAQLLERDAVAVERALLASPKHPADQIGAGWAVCFFRRVRRNKALNTMSVLKA